MNEKKQIIIFWREKWNTIFNIKKNIPIVNLKQYFSFLLSYHLNIKFPESKKKKKRNKYKLIQKWKKKIKIHGVKKRTNVSTSRMRKANGWVGKTGDRMQRVKAQPHASLNFIGRTHSISVHQFSMRNNGIRGILGAVPVVFTGRFYSKLVPGPTILHVLTPAFLVKMNARVSTPSIHRSVLRITSTFMYTRCALRPE